MSTLLLDLTKAVETNDEEGIIENLTRITSQGADIIELQNNTILKSIIAWKNDKITQTFVEVAAELVKQEHNRHVFTDRDIIDYFLVLLEKPDESLVVGAIRALGNICYENDEASKLISKKGLSTVINLLETDNKRKNNLLTMKVSGFLVNLLIYNVELQKAALNLNIINVVEKLLNKYFKNFSENQMLFAFLLTVLNHLTDIIDEQNIPFTESLCCTIIDILQVSTTPEISVLCLEMLHAQSEKDNIRTLLAKRGVCELVFELIEKYRSEVNDEETRSVLRMACDMIVTILTEDECMFLLYNNGQGKVFENMVTWLDSDDSDLLSTGILALGNFARKDGHCTQMVQLKGISKKLIALVLKFNASEGDIKVQHALLSTLKNLVIPKQNKPIVLNEGLIDAIYPMIKFEHNLVVFKLLGTFRMVIDGQEKAALDLISRKDFLERLMYWCYNSDHLGVRGEIPRLLSWLIKHCHSFKPFEALIQTKGCVRCLVEMASSNHEVMQNESFFALNLLCIGCGISNESDSTNGVNGAHGHDDCESLFEQLINASIGDNLNVVMNKYSDKMAKFTIENLLALLEQLVTSPKIFEHLKSKGVGEAVAKLTSNSNAQTFHEKLNHLTEQINKS